MRCSIFLLAMSFCLSPGFSMADNARFQVYAVDERTAAPLAGKNIEGVFLERFQRWENATVDHEFEGETNGKGMYAATGRTNCGEAVFRLHKNLGFYDTPRVKVPFDRAGGKPVPLFQWWKPDNQVVTVKLQRVEHPIPLCVKNVRPKVAPGTFDGTNAVLRYDLVLGDWLPPEGKGERADIEIRTKLTVNEVLQVGRRRKKVFFEFRNEIEFTGEGNGFCAEMTVPTMGIKLRSAPEVGYGKTIVNRFGVKRKIVGPNVNEAEYSDANPNRCYYFRIRSHFDDKGNLVEAYYGKVYGDFNFHGDWYLGFQGFDFLYYLNPKSLDRNLEWDMKTNLCPTAGKHESRQP